jgi:hypothetical protein
VRSFSWLRKTHQSAFAAKFDRFSSTGKGRMPVSDKIPGQPTRGFFHEYKTPNFTQYITEYRSRKQPQYALDHKSERKVALDFARLPLCQHGAEFLEWVLTQYPTLFDSPQHHVLDQAVVSITYESRYRQRGQPSCGLYSCIREVAQELLDMITDLREELLRHPQGQAQAASLYLGEDEGELAGEPGE